MFWGEHFPLLKIKGQSEIGVYDFTGLHFLWISVWFWCALFFELLFFTFEAVSLLEIQVKTLERIPKRRI